VAKMEKIALAARGKFVLQLRRMPRCDKNFRLACARPGVERCRSEVDGANRFNARRHGGAPAP